MALIGNMINQAFSGNPATVNYAMFTSAFSMFTLFYLVPASFNTDWSGHPILLIVLDTLNAIFFLTSGIALAARLGCHDCSNDVRPPQRSPVLQSYTNFAAIHPQQRSHQRRRRPHEAMPRGSGFRGIPLVCLGWVYRVHGPFFHPVAPVWWFSSAFPYWSFSSQPSQHGSGLGLFFFSKDE